MKNPKIIIIGLGLFILGLALYFAVSGRNNRSAPPQTSNSQQAGQTALLAQTLTDGAVTYKVTPKKVASTDTTWDFEIGLDTHSGNLDQDLVNTVRLADDKGNEYKALAWEGDPPGGHHREGILKFSPVSPRPAYIEIHIKTTDSTQKTTLRWNI